MKNKKSLLIKGFILAWIFLGSFFVFVSGARAATVTTAGSGNWNSTTANQPWPGGSVPGSGDDVVIRPGDTVTVTANASINSVTFNNTSATASTLTVNNSFKLTVAAGVTLSSSNSYNTAATISGAGTIQCLSLNVGSTLTASANHTAIITSTITALTVTGNLVINGQYATSYYNNGSMIIQSGTASVGGTVNMNSVTSATATITMNTGAQTGLLKLTGGTPWTAGAGTKTYNLNGSGSMVEYAGSGQTVLATTYRHLTLSGSGTYTMAGATTVNGNFLMSGTVTAAAAGNFGTVGGTLVINSGNSLTVGSSYTLTVTGAVTVGGTLTISTSGANAFNGGITVNGTLIYDTSTAGTKSTTDLTINAGSTFTNSINRALTISGNLAVNGGTITWGTGIYTMSGTAKTIGCGVAVSIPKLTVSSTVQNNCSDLTITSALAGTGGTLTNGNGADLKINFTGAMGLTNLDASAAGNTVEYVYAGAQTINDNATYYTYDVLKVSGSGAKTAGAAMTVNKDFTIAGTATFDGGTSLTHIFKGSWVVTSTAVASVYSYTTSGTINFNTPGTPASTAIGGISGQTTNFYNLNINNISGVSVSSNLAINNASGVLAIGAGVTLTPAATVIISGTGTLNGSGTAQVTRTTATADFLNQYTISTKTYTNLTIDYIGAGAQTVNALAYGGLKVRPGANSATHTFAAGTTTVGLNFVAGNGTNAGAIVDVSANNAILTVTGSFTISANTQFKAHNSNNLTVGGNWTNNGIFTSGTGAVILNGASKQTLSGTMTGSSGFYNLTITNNSGASATDFERTGFVPSVAFATSATVNDTYTITTNHVRVEYNSGSTFSVDNLDWEGGSGANMIYFRNSATSGTWLLNYWADGDIEHYVNVSRSDASSSDTYLSAWDGTNYDANNNTNWWFNTSNGTLGFNIVDGSGNSVTNPAVNFSSQLFSWSAQQSTGTLGDSSQKLRVTNSKSKRVWTLAMAATLGSGTPWDDGGGHTYNFDSTAANGRLQVDATGGTITPQTGCVNTGLSKQVTPAYFSQTNSITILSASASAYTNCYWDFTGVALTQDIPAGQFGGSYTLGLSLTAL